MDKRLSKKWSETFWEGKCPCDEVCFYNKHGDDKACLSCPSGGKVSDCNTSIYDTSAGYNKLYFYSTMFSLFFFLITDIIVSFGGMKGKLSITFQVLR